MSSANSSSSTRNFIPVQCKYNRIVVLVDMDCFYCQVEEKLDPTLKGQPLAVVQYNEWRGGGIIAVNYAARAKGVTRHMRGADAKEQCPEIQLVKVPSVREKADLTKYREAGKDVAKVLQHFTPLLERASVDEAYMDITEKVNKRLEEMNDGSFMLQPQELMTTYAVGYSNLGEYMNLITAHFKNPHSQDYEEFQQAHDEMDADSVRSSDIRLLVGASIVGEIRAAVKAETGFECSAGIAHNKILAKLACGINKPNKQTILPLAQIPILFETLPVGKITGLGGKFGEEICERLNVRFLGQLLKYTEVELQKKFNEKDGTWLYNICRGIDLEAITPRFYSKSIGCCKKFPGRNNIHGIKTLKHWLNELAAEICDRLAKDLIENNRTAKQMVVSFLQEFNGGEDISSSRSAPLSSYDHETIAKQSLDIIQLNTKQFFRVGNEMVLNNPIKFLGISVGKFETITNAQSKLQEMFAKQANKTRKHTEMEEHNETNENKEKGLVSKVEAKNKLEKGSNRNREEQKMKSFFANYLQGKNETQQNSNTSKIEVEDQNSVNENFEERQEHIPHKSTEKVITHTESNSFFANFLKRQNNKTELPLKKNANEKIGKSDLESKSNGLYFNILPQAETKDKILLASERNLNTIECNIDYEESATEKFNYKENDAIDNLITLNSDLEMMPKEIENEAFPTFENNTAVLFTDNNMYDTHLNEIQSKKRKFIEIAEYETNQNYESKDYKANYVEFSTPDLRPEYIQFTKCETCNAKLPNDDRSLQMHQDHHFAQQLNLQQRIEYREEIKKKVGVTKLSPPTSKKASKKLKKVTHTASKDSKSNITKFLKTTTSIATPSPSPTLSSLSLASCTSSDEIQICNECKLSIKMAEMPEHQDFHMAKELQKKLNQLEVRTVTIAKKSTKSLNSSTSITQFFSQPNC